MSDEDPPAPWCTDTVSDEEPPAPWGQEEGESQGGVGGRVEVTLSQKLVVLRQEGSIEDLVLRLGFPIRVQF